MIKTNMQHVKWLRLRAPYLEINLDSNIKVLKLYLQYNIRLIIYDSKSITIDPVWWQKEHSKSKLKLHVWP